MAREIIPPEEAAEIEAFITKYFPGTSTQERRTIQVDLQFHTGLKIYAMKRGWSIQWALQHLITLGMEYEFKKAAEENERLKSCAT